MAARYRKRKTRNKTRTMVGWIFFFATVAVFSALICLVLFFKLETITVTGVSRYQSSDIIRESGIETGENIFAFRAGEVQKKLLSQYPYLDEVKVRRILPHMVEIAAEEAKPAFSVIASVGRYTIISESGRVLTQGRGISTERVIRVMGADFSKLPEGADIAAEAEKLQKRRKDPEERPGLYDELYPEALEKLKIVQNVLKAVEESELENISYVDISDDLSVTLLVDQRVLVSLGTDYEMSYKLKFVARVLEELGSTFSGTLDCALVPGTGKVYSREQDIISLLHPVYVEGYY